MNTILRAGLALALITGAATAGYVSGAQNRPAATPRTLKINQVARVGENVITAEQFIERLMDAEKLMPGPERRAPDILNGLLMERLLQAEADRLEARIKPRERAAEVETLRQGLVSQLESENERIKAEQRRAGQPERGYTWEEWLRLRLEMSEHELITLLTIRADNNLLKRMVIWYWFQSTQNIDIMLMQFDSREDADSALKRLRDGEDFSNLARAVSKHPSARQAKAGVLSEVFASDGTLDPEVDAAVWALRDGQLSPPVQSGDAWYVLKRVKSNPVNEAQFADMRDLCLARPNVPDNMLQRWRNNVSAKGTHVVERRMPGWDCRADE